MKSKNNLKELREKHHAQISDLAKLLNISQHIYLQYKNGKFKLTASMFIRLTYFHNTSIDYLLGRTNIPTPYPKRK